jgi:hypothetical protein
MKRVLIVGCVLLVADGCERKAELSAAQITKFSLAALKEYGR